MSSEKFEYLYIGAIPTFCANEGAFLAINCIIRKSDLPTLATWPLEMAEYEGKHLVPGKAYPSISCFVTKGEQTEEPIVIVKKLESDKGIVDLYTVNTEYEMGLHHCLLFHDQEISKYKSIFPDNAVCFIHIEGKTLRVSFNFAEWYSIDSETIDYWLGDKLKLACDIIELENGYTLIIPADVRNLIIQIMTLGQDYFNDNYIIQLEKPIMKRLE